VPFPPIRRTPRRVALPAEVDGECVFCAIVAGRAEQSLVATTDLALAFPDVQPAVTGHAPTCTRSRARPATACGSTAASGWCRGVRSMRSRRGCGRLSPSRRGRTRR
jgi:hypothetical protein